MWSENAKPTRTNARRRIVAALDCLTAAETLIVLMPKQPGLAELRNASAWATSSLNRLGGNDHKRRLH